jgi:hypothetical protein
MLKIYIGLLVLFAACALPPSSATDEVIASVDKVMQAINQASPQLLDEWMTANALVTMVTDDGKSHASTRSEMQSSLMSGGKTKFHERTWGHQVKISGGLASVWVNYEFTIDNEFSHAGVNAIHLVNADGKWWVNNITYSVRD